jgi:hypothetical protein
VAAAVREAAAALLNAGWSDTVYAASGRRGATVESKKGVVLETPAGATAPGRGRAPADGRSPAPRRRDRPIGPIGALDLARLVPLLIAVPGRLHARRRVAVSRPSTCIVRDHLHRDRASPDRLDVRDADLLPERMVRDAGVWLAAGLKPDETG